LSLVVVLNVSVAFILLRIICLKDRSRAGFRNVVFFKNLLNDGQSTDKEDCIYMLYTIVETF
jgi:hypothetical protein